MTNEFIFFHPGGVRQTCCKAVTPCSSRLSNFTSGVSFRDDLHDRSAALSDGGGKSHGSLKQMQMSQTSVSFGMSLKISIVVRNV